MWIVDLLKKMRPDLLKGKDTEKLGEAELRELLEKAIKEETDATKKAELETEKAQKEKEATDAAEKKAADEKAAKEATDKVQKEAEEKAAKEARDADAQTALTKTLDLIKNKKYAEALASLQAWVDKPKTDVSEAIAKQFKDLVEQVKALEAKGKETEAKIALDASAKMVEELISRAKLPEPAKDKLKASFAGKVATKEDIEAAVKAERVMLAKLTESGDVDLEDFFDTDKHDIKLGRTGIDRMQLALDLTLDPSLKEEEKDTYEGIQPFEGIREAYVKFTHDPTISGVIPRERLKEATTSDVTYAFDNSMTKIMVKDYKKVPKFYPELCDVVSVKDFKQQERIRWGGFAELETVSESTSSDYPEIAFPGDEEATYTPATRGGIVTITRRMIINDDVRMLRKIPKKLARAASRTLDRFVFDLLLGYASAAINGDTIYDSLALYHINHFNLGSAALDPDSFGDRLEALQEQREYGYSDTLSAAMSDTTTASFSVDDTNGEGENFNVGDYVIVDAEILGPVSAESAGAVTAARGAWGTTAATHLTAVTVRIITDDLMLNAGNLWAPTNLREDARAVLENDKIEGTLQRNNPYKGICKLQIVPRGMLRGDTNNWYLTAKKEDIDLIELGFVGGKEEPTLVIQDAPGVGNVFVRDNIRYKVRHEYGGDVIDFRGFQGAIVS